MKSASIIAFAAMIALPMSLSAAWTSHSKKNVKVINESATALESSNPDLSSRLKEFATRESSEKESSETAVQQKDDVQLLHDSANALQATRPDLAKSLTGIANEETKGMRKGAAPMNQNKMPQGSQGY